MKFITRPKVEFDEIEVVQGGWVGPFEKMFKSLDDQERLRRQRANSIVKIPGKMKVSNVIIDDPNNEISSRDTEETMFSKQDLVVDGIKLFGLWPISKKGTEVTCSIDHFEE